MIEAILIFLACLAICALGRKVFFTQDDSDGDVAGRRDTKSVSESTELSEPLSYAESPQAEERRLQAVKQIRERTFRPETEDLDAFCLLLRSSEADAKLSATFLPAQTISDRYDAIVPRPYRFRRHLYERMQPVHVRAIKNDFAIEELVSLDYGDDWKPKVLDDMSRCAFLLAVPIFASDALRWELEVVFEKGWEKRLYFLMPPLQCLRSQHFEHLASAGQLNDYRSRRRAIELFWNETSFLKCALNTEMLKAWLEGLEMLQRDFGVPLGKYRESGGAFMHYDERHWGLYIEWDKMSGTVFRAGAEGRLIRVDDPSDA